MLKQRGKGKSAELARWLEEHRPARIGEAEFALLRRPRPGVRKLSAQAGAGMRRAARSDGRRRPARHVRGTGSELARLLAEYERGDPARRMAVRRLVITAKDHARLAARNPSQAAGKRGNDSVDDHLAGESAGVQGVGEHSARTRRPGASDGPQPAMKQPRPTPEPAFLRFLGPELPVACGAHAHRSM